MVSLLVLNIADNGNYKLFAVVQVHFEFDVGGKIEQKVHISVLDLEMGGTIVSWINVGYTLLGLYILHMALTELSDLYMAWRYMGGVAQYFVSFWNYADLSQVALFMM